MAPQIAPKNFMNPKTALKKFIVPKSTLPPGACTLINGWFLREFVSLKNQQVR